MTAQKLAEFAAKETDKLRKRVALGIPQTMPAIQAQQINALFRKLAAHYDELAAMANDFDAQDAEAERGAKRESVYDLGDPAYTPRSVR